MYLLLFINLLFFSFQNEIIRDLPSNIYHIEDMSQFESKSIPEGTKYYIRLPKTNSPIKLYLTIPKNIQIFPLYSAEFTNQPNDNQIVNKDYIKEVSLKTKEDLEYSIYSFDIEKSDSHKVLYFKNNEILNYLSLYAQSLSSSNFWIKDLPFEETSHIDNVEVDFIYFFRVNIEQYDKINIVTKSDKDNGKNASILVGSFSYYPENQTIEGYLEWNKVQKSSESTNVYTESTYSFSKDTGVKYIVVKVTTSANIVYFDIKLEKGSNI